MSAWKYIESIVDILSRLYRIDITFTDLTVSKNCQRFFNSFILKVSFYQNYLSSKLFENNDHTCVKNLIIIYIINFL